MRDKLKRIASGKYQGMVYFGHRATIARKHAGREPQWLWIVEDMSVEWNKEKSEYVRTNTVMVAGGCAASLKEAKTNVAFYGRTTMVTRKNLLSDKEFQISLDQAGTCCDPATETYHSM